MALDLSKLPKDELSVLAELLSKAQTHADPTDPRQFPPEELANDAARTPNVLKSLAMLAFSSLLPMLLGEVEKLIKRKINPLPKPAPTPEAPPFVHPGAPSRPDPSTLAPAWVPPAQRPPSVPTPVQHSGGLESWPEEFWADAFTRYPDQGEKDAAGNPSDWAASGTPIYNDIMSGAKGAPSNVVVRFMTGVLPQPSSIPGQDGFVEPFPIEHVFEVDGVTHVLPSTTNIDGGQNPIADFGKPQGGPRWQKSSGWDVTVRIKPNANTERTVTYYARGGGKQSEPKSFRVAKGR